jgi:hypothetical protein
MLDGGAICLGDTFFIVAERPVGGLNIFPVGEALTHCRPVGARDRVGQSPLGHLGVLAREAGVRPLAEFLSEDSEPHWFAAGEGLATIRGLLDYLTSHTERAADVRPVLGELRQAEAVLRRLYGEGCRWHLEDGSAW